MKPAPCWKHEAGKGDDDKVLSSCQVYMARFMFQFKGFITGCFLLGREGSMSEWSNWSNDKDSSANKRKRTRDKKQVFKPYVCVLEPSYSQTMDSMTRNKRGLRPDILLEKLGILASYYEAKWL